MVYQTLRRYFHMASIGDQSYRFLFKRPPPGEVVAFDCETTGLDVAKDDIITIAAVLIKRPETNIKPDAMKIHQLREADVENQLPIRKILRIFCISSGPAFGGLLPGVRR